MSESFAQYYRKWNLVVHEYLHTYLYKDLIILTKNKSAATALTFLISIIAHEYSISFICGFFLPILGIHFLTSALLLRIEHYKLFNFLLIFALPIGTAIELSLYTMEFYARQNCAIEDENFWKYFQFRMLTCNGLNL